MTLPHNYHPHSRYVLKEAPWGYQALDLIHNTPDGPVFDLGVDVDDKFGVAFIRVTDVEEMARVLGMSTREETQELKRQLKESENKVNNLPAEVEGLKDGLDGLVSSFLDRLDSIVSPSVEVPAESESGEPSGAVGDNSAGNSTVGQDGKPSLDKRPAKLSGNSSDEPIFGFDGIDGK